jgi:hypothetical protein
VTIPGHATLAHVTLTSGDVRHSPRHEVGDQVVTLLAPLLARVLAGATVDVPYVEGEYVLEGVADADCCALTVTGACSGLLVATLGIAAGETGSAALWRQLHAYAPDTSPLATRADAPPSAPWCAARLDRGAVAHPGALTWLGDLERCLAWTYLEERARATGG